MNKCVAYVVLGMASFAGFTGCSSDNKGEEEVKPQTLVLTPSTSAINFGGEITFAVTEADKDVTASATIVSLDENNKPVTSAWTSAKAGLYRFSATYGGKTSNEVTCIVSEFKHRVLAVDFTSVFCTYCPMMTKRLQEFEAEYPGLLVPLAAHVRVYNDPWLTEETLALAMTAIGASNTGPYLWLDYQPVVKGRNTVMETPDSNAALMKAVKNLTSKYPALCGIGISSTVDGDKVKAEVSARFTTVGDFKIGVVLVEDKLTVVGKDEVQNDVIHKFATNIMGDDIGTCGPDKEFKKTFEFTVDPLWKVENCRVVAFLLRNEDGKYIPNNARSCDVDGAVEIE